MSFVLALVSFVLSFWFSANESTMVKMKYALIGYAILMALALSFKPAAAAKGPACGAGVLCIRTQREARQALQASSQRYTEQFKSQASGQ